jgi:hypothetical protein
MKKLLIIEAIEAIENFLQLYIKMHLGTVSKPVVRKKEYHDRMKKLSIHHSIYSFVIST